MFASSATAQITTGVQGGEALEDRRIDSTRGIFNDPSFIVVPVPVSNPTIGTGGALVGAVFFRTDEASASSFIGGGGFYTNSNSWGAGLLASISFDEDRYRAKASGGYGDVNFKFYGIGLGPADTRPHVTLYETGYLAQAVMQRRVAPNFYAGGLLRYVSIKTSFTDPVPAETVLGGYGLAANLDSSVWSLGAVATFDTRDRDYSPQSGQLVETEFTFNTQNFVLSNHYMRLITAYSRYDEISENLVLASHASLCAIDGKPPVFDLCLFGMDNDLRGYPVGQFQNKAMFAAQAELRWRAFGRFGFVAFGGIGSVGRSFSEFKNLLAAGGVGIRFLASREYGVNVGIDGAINKDGEKTVYFLVGEAF